MSWRQWFVLLAIFIGYLLFGGFIFVVIESPYEVERNQELENIRNYIYGKHILDEWHIIKMRRLIIIIFLICQIKLCRHWNCVDEFVTIFLYNILE